MIESKAVSVWKLQALPLVRCDELSDGENKHSFLLCVKYITQYFTNLFPLALSFRGVVNAQMWLVTIGVLER